MAKWHTEKIRQVEVAACWGPADQELPAEGAGAGGSP